MSPLAFTLLPGRPRDIGGFTVRRSLPAPNLRMVGPFVFWDHMGPVKLEPGHGMDVRPHPHINLATVTYLFDGEIVHKDSLGSDQAIQPGDVNWMTAGRGIVHSERTGAALRKSGPSLHGLQFAPTRRHAWSFSGALPSASATSGGTSSRAPRPASSARSRSGETVRSPGCRGTTWS